MAGIIKGQILKHLSKFVKNLSPSQINLSTLKGEGELKNLELNVEVLGELLELPTWVRLTQATCNRAAIRIQWTKLKSVPIQLSLDEIRVKIETCEELRTGEGSGVVLLQPPSGTYGFTEKIVDGITVTVNLVHVSLTSLAFTASFQMSRIVLESRGPSWQKASLPHTRLKDLDKGEVLTFKELSWQTVRIEAKSTVQEDLTPLRLITNQARCRITLKKRMSDCAILGARIVLILDDLLWVLTDDQLKAAIHFIDSVSGLIKKATEKTQKVKAARKLENQKSTESVAMRRSSVAKSVGESKSFRKYDVIETSYHFYSDRIDLHFCDDPGGGRSEHPELEGGGAFQVSLAKLQMDYYPYHLARGDRKHWVRYNIDSPHKAWMQSGLAQFDTRLLDELLAGQNKIPLSRAGRGTFSGRDVTGSLTSGEEGLRDLVVSQLSRMMVAVVVLRLADLTLWRVSTSSSPSAKSQSPSELLKGDSARLHLPPDLPLFHLELSNYFYPGHQDFPLPPPCLLLTANPVTVWLDVLTLVWLNAFTLNLQKSVTELQKSLQLDGGDAAYVDIKVELLMPRVICSSRHPPPNPSDLRPTSLQVSASKISIANYRSRETGSKADLATALDKFQQAGLFFGGTFPSKSQDPVVVHQKFVSHAIGKDIVREGGQLSTVTYRRDLLWTEARDIWHLAVDSVWAEFSIPGSHRPVPLLDAAPLQVWIYVVPETSTEEQNKEGGKERPSRKLLAQYYGTSREEDTPKVGVHALALASQLVSLQLDHDQLLFLLRLAESISEMGAFLSADSARIVAAPTGMVVGAVLPQVDLSIILPVDESVHDGGGIDVDDTVLDSTVKEILEEPIQTENVLGSTHELLPGGHIGTLTHINDQSDPLSSPIISSQVVSEVVALASEETTSVVDLTITSPSLDKEVAAETSQFVEQSYCIPPHLAIKQPPPPKLTLAPKLSTNGLTPDLASALDKLQQSSSLSSTTPTSRRGLWGLWGDSASPGHLPQGHRAGGKSPDMDFDTLSVRSDDSGDSSWTDLDTLSIVMESEASLGDGLFRVERDDAVRGGVSPMVSPCMEMAEEAGSSLGERRESCLEETKETGDRLVTVLTLHLGRMAAAQLSGGSSSSLLMTSDTLSISEGPTQEYHQFQFRFGQSGKSWSESTLTPTPTATLSFRLDSTPPAHPAQALASFPPDLHISWGERIARDTDGYLEAVVSGFSLNTTSSTLARLNTWVMDEVVPTPLPLTLTLSDIMVHLLEDTPPPIGYPAPPPLDLTVTSLTVSRDKEGVVSVQGGDSPTSSKPPANQMEVDLRKELELARAEVRVLRAKMGQCEGRVKEADAKVRQMDMKLHQADSRVESMVEEKKGLLDTLSYLQQELLKSGKK